jgi:hypothetical protein
MGRAIASREGIVVTVKWLDHFAERFLWAAKAMIFVSLGLLVLYAADREPPFEVLSVEPAEARPGDQITIYASVRRDVSRGCSAEFSRYVFDARGMRHDMGTSIASAQMIADMQRRTPGQLIVTFQVPANASPGQARLDSVLHYRCNKVHSLWPIDVTTSLPFMVLP